MRAWMVAGATTLVVTLGSQAADARAGRGFGRLFSGYSRPTHRTAAPSPSTGPRSEPRVATLSYRPAVDIAPRPVPSSAAVGAVMPAPSGVTVAISSPPGSSARPEAAGDPLIQEARAVRPSCAPGRTVGGSGQDGTGFCLLN
jgi:hypothetical protein